MLNSQWKTSLSTHSVSQKPGSFQMHLNSTIHAINEQFRGGNLVGLSWSHPANSRTSLFY